MPACLICGREARGSHLGIDACRACTVFFRRQRSKRNTLVCMERNDKCTNFQESIHSCRKCRLARFDDVMAAGKKEDTKDIISTPRSRPEQADLLSMEKGASADIGPPLQKASLSIIERTRDSHRALSSTRRIAECRLLGITLDPFEAAKEDLVPCTYQTMHETTRILISGLFDFIPAVFPEFASFPTEDKWLLIRNFHTVFLIIDSAMRMHPRWGMNIDFILSSYTTYISPDTVEIFFSDCPDQKNVGEAVSTMRQCIHENCVGMKKQMGRVHPTEDEYLALVGIALWSIENAETGDKLISLASRYRTEILTDLTERYRRTIGVEEGAIRIGELFSLLVGIKVTFYNCKLMSTKFCKTQIFQKIEMNMKWEYELYRMLNVFDEKTSMFRL
ncbi:hypothetical protein PMAYCL1PPCAC_16683 [Pristionchus mayeri]|uniref:Nuclear receptor n=1 Tax=Pristionchus mayeri TaxID=1317129 RepID=A0AAN5CL86_9BILA|nr:hypothetical protein PMAYCL1PPCAC_16683 [Pristionchus mayeri]